MATAARRRAVSAVAHLVLARRERLAQSSTPAGSARPAGVVPHADVSAPREVVDQSSPGRGGQQSGEGDLSAA